MLASLHASFSFYIISNFKAFFGAFEAAVHTAAIRHVTGIQPYVSLFIPLSFNCFRAACKTSRHSTQDNKQANLALQADAVRSSARSRSRTKRVQFIRLEPFLVNVTIILLINRNVVPIHSALRSTDCLY